MKVTTTKSKLKELLKEIAMQNQSNQSNEQNYIKDNVDIIKHLCSKTKYINGMANADEITNLDNSLADIVNKIYEDGFTDGYDNALSDESEKGHIGI